MFLRQLFAIGLLLVTASSTAVAHEKESAYDRVMRTQTIRCGYALVEPYMSKDPNTGELSGISYTITNKIGAMLHLKIEWAEEVGFAAMTDGLGTGRYDMVCSAHMINGARARVADFTTPVAYAPLAIYVRKDDKRFKSLSDLNNEKVSFSSIDGTPTPQFLKDFFPKAKLHTLPELSTLPEVLLAVSAKKADATMVPAFEGAHFAAVHAGTVRKIGDPLVMMANAMILPRDEYAFKAMIDSALEELRSNGYLKRVVEDGSVYPDSVYPSRSPFAPAMGKD